MLEPQTGSTGVFVATIDHARVREERQNLDGAGHYSRPDVTRLIVNTERQAIAELRDGPTSDA